MAASAEGTAGAELPVALCLSGGGYRAMLFHAGALLRLCELRWVQRLDLVSSVSGGSIVAGHLASQWDAMIAGDDLSQSYRDLVLNPLLSLSRQTIDMPAVARGFATPGGSARRVAAAYGKHLFHGKTFQEIPDHPRFVINATNMQSGALWRFSKSYARDYKVGGIEKPDVGLAEAVAASSAFPPFLSPAILRFSPDAWSWRGADPRMQREPYTSRVVLSDGGIYDNLALESAKRCTTLLVSDGGGHLSPTPRPQDNWLGQLRRVLAVEDNQVRALRKRALIDGYQRNSFTGAYWGIRTDIENYHLADALPCPYTEALRLAAIRTRLASPSERDRFELVNWGYAVCDAALRAHVDRSLSPPTEFPFPEVAL
ncbi:patatin-like phospholipase family protein [Streptomyces sp. NBC_01456]|uniref:patatin-like phospholipase family protein n=1 Tax=Streptomyces sp. NBC_01456 TaxID=2975868 RepID=UPI002E310BE8|nr:MULTISPECIES: patatin-like phospholipase family protein [unclassified Streptomyces]